MAESDDLLLGKLQPLLAAGRLDLAAPVLREGALALLAREDADAGVTATALLGAAGLAQLRGDLGDARDLVNKARAPALRSGQQATWLRHHAELLEAEAQPAAAHAAWEEAARGGGKTRDVALTRLAELYKGSGRPAQAAACYDQLLQTTGRPAGERAALLLERSLCRHAAGDADAADLDQAEALLGPGDDGLRARILGQRGVLALAAGDPQGALRLGLAARDAAVRATDILAYLPAATFIAAVQLQVGQEVAAYDTLVRARVSLKDLLGPDGEALVQPVLDVFAQKVGPRLAEIRDRWVAERRAKKS